MANTKKPEETEPERDGEALDDADLDGVSGGVGVPSISIRKPPQKIGPGVLE